jgi:hypothetical protein
LPDIHLHVKITRIGERNSKTTAEFEPRTTYFTQYITWVGTRVPEPPGWGIEFGRTYVSITGFEPRAGVVGLIGRLIKIQRKHNGEWKYIVPGEDGIPSEEVVEALLEAGYEPTPPFRW